jgi:hypothetical protein
MAQSQQGSQGQRVQVKVFDVATGAEVHSAETTVLPGRPVGFCSCSSCHVIQPPLPGPIPQQ